MSPLPGLRLQSFSLSLLRTTFGLRWSRIPEFAGNIIILLSSLSRRIEAMPTTRSRDDFRVRHVCSWQILLRKSAAADGRSANHLGAMGFDPPTPTLCTQLLRYAMHKASARGGRAISDASRRRFWAMAARTNSSWAPRGPRSRSRPSFRMRFKCANRCEQTAKAFVGMTQPALSE